jgi:hypothetical protein
LRASSVAAPAVSNAFFAATSASKTKSLAAVASASAAALATYLTIEIPGEGGKERVEGTTNKNRAS